MPKRSSRYPMPQLSLTVPYAQEKYFATPCLQSPVVPYALGSHCVTHAYKVLAVPMPKEASSGTPMPRKVTPYPMLRGSSKVAPCQVKVPGTPCLSKVETLPHA